jgi:hypothetical protein
LALAVVRGKARGILAAAAVGVKFSELQLICWRRRTRSKFQQAARVARRETIPAPLDSPQQCALFCKPAAVVVVGCLPVRPVRVLVGIQAAVGAAITQPLQTVVQPTRSLMASMQAVMQPAPRVTVPVEALAMEALVVTGQGRQAAPGALAQRIQ